MLLIGVFLGFVLALGLGSGGGRSSSSNGSSSGSGLAAWMNLDGRFPLDFLEERRTEADSTTLGEVVTFGATFVVATPKVP